MPQSNLGNLNFEWASSLIDGLYCTGVSQAVISPGSRSTPLVLACEYHTGITNHLIIDERCASFFALGLAKSSGAPVILIATSGSAPAHWLPAVIEASHSKVPLILLTADRPPELVGTGANQTTDQSKLFVAHTRFQLDPGAPRAEALALKTQHALGRRVATQSCWPNPGPVHLNLPFAEPLLPSTPKAGQISDIKRPSPPTITVNEAQLAQLKTGFQSVKGFIVCGPAVEQNPSFNHAITELAKHLDAPILADPLSGLRWGDHQRENILCNYDTFLRDQSHWPDADWILRFGTPPVSKSLLHLLQQTTAKQFVCDPYGDWPDPFHCGPEMIYADPTSLCSALIKRVNPRRTANGIFISLNQLDETCQPSHTGEASLPIEAGIVNALFDQLPDTSLILAGNSMPIRHLDSWGRKGSRDIQVVGNRGVSGIDGHNATLAGLAEGSGRRCLSIVGDLTFYHDMNGLASLAERDVIIVLLNNNGGGIFGYLPQSKLDSYEAYWATPMNLDFKCAAQLYGLQHQRSDNPEQFSIQLAKALLRQGPQLLEVIIDRDESIRLHNAFWQKYRNN